MVEFSETWTRGSVDPPKAADSDALAARRDQWIAAGERHRDPEMADFTRSALESAGPSMLLNAVFGNSPYLSHVLLEDVAFTKTLLADGPDAVMQSLMSDVDDRTQLGVEKRPELMSRLRRAKRRFSTAAAMADISGCSDVMTLAAMLSRFAGSCLEASASALLREGHERGKLRLADPGFPTRNSGLILLGLGKLGASELNFSSDIDIIVLFDDNIAEVEFNAHQQVFSRIARNIVELMARRTEDGYVFRTDLRLRPDPSSTPPAVSVTAALAYYRSVGQTWERAAMIKARPVAGDIDAGNAFLEANKEFVWRRSLDFASVRDIQSIKRQIDANKGSRRIAVEGQNVKLGQGGIREIEFLTQTHQLIWGGQVPELQGKTTLDMLALLASLGRVPRPVADELAAAYRLLRRIEHRIQMVDDQQTHSVPTTAEGVERLAVFLGHPGGDEFRRQLVRTLETVRNHYDGTFERRPAGGAAFEFEFGAAESRDVALKAFAEHGFDQPEQAWDTVCRWLTGQTLATRSERAASVMTEIVPRLFAAFAESEHPDTTLARFDAFLARVARSIGFLEMLSAQPALCDLISDIMSAAPKLSDWLRQDPGLLESVLAGEFADLELPDDLGLEEHVIDSARRGLVRVHYQLEFGREELNFELAGQIDHHAQGGADLQAALDVHRRWARRRVFQIGVHMLRGYLSPTEASAPLCRIAETCLDALLPAIRHEFAARHGTVEGGRLAIIACGKLGSQEMTVASDLDLIFVYDHPEQVEGSDGEKPLSPTQYYAKLCRRFLNGVTAPTAEGRLYEVDMRLRPSGKSGPIACSLDRFVSYQERDAWTWEHQVLTRARVIFAEDDLESRLNDAVRTVLCHRRNPKRLAADIRSMRERIRTEAAEGGGNSIKHRPGGILDVEFMAQFLQLAHAESHPDILLRDAHSVFEAAGRLNLIDGSVAEDLAEAILYWRNLQGLLLLAAEDNRPEKDMERAVAGNLGAGSQGVLYSSFIRSIEDTAEMVSDHFNSMLPSGD